MVLPRDMCYMEYQTNPLVNAIFAGGNQNDSLSRDENSPLVPSETGNERQICENKVRYLVLENCALKHLLHFLTLSLLWAVAFL